MFYKENLTKNNNITIHMRQSDVVNTKLKSDVDTVSGYEITNINNS